MPGYRFFSMRRRFRLGCLGTICLFLVTFAIVGGWQLFESITNPAVSAIHTHPVAATAKVIEPEIDGVGGDAAVSYRYSVGHHTYDGFDVGSKATGDVLVKRPGDPIPIQYAATMPQVSCVADSTDCPNSVYDPYLFAFVFWALALLTGLAFAIRSLARHMRRRPAA